MCVFNLIIKIIILLLSLILTIIFYTYWERKFIGLAQDRIGPNRVGPFGLLQPIADPLKLLFKSIVFPKQANKFLFILGPIIVVVTALSAWAVIPFSSKLVLANINIGVLYILAIILAKNQLLSFWMVFMDKNSTFLYFYLHSRSDILIDSSRRADHKYVTIISF